MPTLLAHLGAAIRPDRDNFRHPSAVGGHHPVMGLVGGDGLLDQPRSHEVQGFAFPGLVLPAVLNQF